MEPTLGKWRQETREFKAILSYTGSSKPELGYMRPLKIEKKKSAKVSSGRAWKVAQSATCLLCKHEDLSSGSQLPCTKPGAVVYNPSTGGWWPEELGQEAEPQSSWNQLA